MLLKPPEQRTLEICFVDPMGYTGAAYYDCSLLRGLSSLGHRVHWITPRPTLLPQGSMGDVTLHECYQGYPTTRGKLRKAVSYATSTRRALGTIRRLRPDIVHFEFPLLAAADLALTRSISRAGIPLVTTIHDTEPFHGGKLDRAFRSRISETCRGVIVLSEFSRRRFLSTAPRRVPVQVIHHPNYSPALPTVPSRAEALERLGLSPDTRILLFFGGLREEKGLGVLLRALPGIREACGDVLLLVAGGPPRTFSFDVERSRGLARELGVERLVRWELRSHDHEEMVTAFAAARAVVLPYLRIDMSGVLLLAMTLGKPIVASAVGGFPEVVESGRNGLLVPPGDPPALASAVSRVLGSDELGRRLGEAARQSALSSHSPGQIARETAGFYLRILGDHGNP
jgi:glycosyltransferase involved in cell wall biosynthesis